jgi:hypothetical protein
MQCPVARINNDKSASHLGNQALTRCAFVVTNPTGELITSGLPVIRPQSRIGPAESSVNSTILRNHFIRWGKCSRFCQMRHLLQLPAFSVGVWKEGNGGIGVFPEGEDVLISSVVFAGVC